MSEQIRLEYCLVCLLASASCPLFPSPFSSLSLLLIPSFHNQLLLCSIQLCIANSLYLFLILSQSPPRFYDYLYQVHFDISPQHISPQIHAFSRLMSVCLFEFIISVSASNAAALYDKPIDIFLSHLSVSQFRMFTLHEVMMQSYSHPRPLLGFSSRQNRRLLVFPSFYHFSLFIS